MLAVALTGRGELDRAVQLLLREVQLIERLFGPSHPIMSYIMVSLGVAHAAGRNYAAAEAVLRRGLATREAAVGPDHPHVPEALANLGRVLRQQGKLDEAVLLGRRSVELAERLLPAADFLSSRRSMSSGSSKRSSARSRTPTTT
jgi:tetratricopeptide (TPR) repeat protein